MKVCNRESVTERKNDKDYWRYYFPIEGQRFNRIKLCVYYSKGGYNYFTSETNKRGYYVSITPVVLHERENGIVSEESTLFGSDGGGKLFLEETTRFNAKKMPEMEKLGAERIEPFFEQMLAKYESVVA